MFKCFYMQYAIVIHEKFIWPFFNPLFFYTDNTLWQYLCQQDIFDILNVVIFTTDCLRCCNSATHLWIVASERSSSPNVT